MRRLIKTPNGFAWCALVVSAEAVLILWPLGQRRSVLLSGDGTEYDRYALNLVRHNVFSNAVSPPFHPGVTRTPGYPAFLALLHLIHMNSGLVVRIVQFALIAVIAWLVHGIALELADVRSARISAGLCATYLPLLWLATHALTEVLASALVALLVFLLVKGRKTVSVRLWIAVGLTLAAGAYVRPEVAGLGIVVGLGVLLSGRGRLLSRSRLLPPIILLATMVLALAPWVIRNASVTDSFVPLDTGAGLDLLASADQYAGTFPVRGEIDWPRFTAQETAITATVAVAKLNDRTAREQVAASNALTQAARNIMSHLSLGTILKRVPSRLAAFWGFADAPPTGRSWSTLARRAGQLQYGLLFILTLAGIVVRRRLLAREWPLWVVAVYLTVLHLVSHAASRYSLPARPTLFVYAGTTATVVLGSIGHARRRRGSIRQLVAKHDGR